MYRIHSSQFRLSHGLCNTWALLTLHRYVSVVCISFSFEFIATEVGNALSERWKKKQKIGTDHPNALLANVIHTNTLTFIQ